MERRVKLYRFAYNNDILSDWWIVEPKPHSAVAFNLGQAASPLGPQGESFVAVFRTENFNFRKADKSSPVDLQMIKQTMRREGFTRV